MNIFKCSLIALLLSFELNAGYVLESDGDINIKTPILLMNGVMTLPSNPEVAALFRRDDTLGPNDLIFRTNTGTINIEGVQVAVIGGNLSLEALNVRLAGSIFANAGIVSVMAQNRIYHTGINLIAPETRLQGNGGISFEGNSIPLERMLRIFLEGQPIDEVVPVINYLDAAMNGHVAQLELLLRNQVQIPSERDIAGNNLWLAAAEWGQVGTLGWLLTNRIPGQDATNRFGNNLWLAAAGDNRVAVLEWLNQNNIPGRDAVNARGQNIRQLAEAENADEALAWVNEHMPQRAVAATAGVARSGSAVLN